MVRSVTLNDGMSPESFIISVIIVRATVYLKSDVYNFSGKCRKIERNILPLSFSRIVFRINELNEICAGFKKVGLRHEELPSLYNSN